MVYLGEGCLDVAWQGVWFLGICYLGALCPGEGTEMERELPGVMVMGQGRPSRHLSQGRMSTAEGKERTAAAGDAGETAAFPGSMMRLQDFVYGLDGFPSLWEPYFH